MRPAIRSGLSASADSAPILQHFEFAVATAIRELNENAYPAKIAEHLTESLKRHVSIAQVFVCLERLEDKHFVQFTVLPPSPVRGGRRRKLFRLKESGVQAMRDTAAAYRVLTSKEENHEIPERPLTA